MVIFKDEGIGEKNHLKNEKKVSEHTYASIARVRNSGRLSKKMGNLMIFPFDVNKTLKMLILVNFSKENVKLIF